MTGSDSDPGSDNPSPIATVCPSNVEIAVHPGETVMAAAQRAGYRWPTVCGGEGTCRTCYLEVADGLDNCSTVDQLEEEGIAALKRPNDGRTRLACQLHIAGDVTVVKRGVRPTKRI